MNELDDEVRGRQRPPGIVFLSLFHFLAGVAIIALQILAEPDGQHEGEIGIRLIQTPVSLVKIGWLLLGGLSIVSAVGLWSGRPWGWWTAAVLHVRWAFTSGRGFLAALRGSAEFAESEVATGYFLLGFAIRITIAIVVLAYLFRRNTRHYCGCQALAARKALPTLIAVVLVWVALMEIARLSADH